MGGASLINQTYFVEVGLLARLRQTKQYYWKAFCHEIKGLLKDYCNVFYHTVNDSFFSLQLHSLSDILDTQKLIPLH